MKCGGAPLNIHEWLFRRDANGRASRALTKAPRQIKGAMITDLNIKTAPTASEGLSVSALVAHS